MRLVLAASLYLSIPCRLYKTSSCKPIDMGCQVVLASYQGYLKNSGTEAQLLGSGYIPNNIVSTIKASAA